MDIRCAFRGSDDFSEQNQDWSGLSGAANSSLCKNTPKKRSQKNANKSQRQQKFWAEQIPNGSAHQVMCCFANSVIRMYLETRDDACSDHQKSRTLAEGKPRFPTN